MAARAKPTGTPVCGQLVQKPRRRSSPYSIDRSTEPPHSPPTPAPCKKRKMESRIGAARPIWAYPGSRPIKTVAIPMSRRVAISVDLRPTRSPNQPKKAPPIGRARQPSKLDVNDEMVAATGPSVGKKRFGKEVAARKPHKKQSYHSRALPLVLAWSVG